MSWTATIKRATPTQSENFDIDVEFSDGEGTSFVRQFRLSADQYNTPDQVTAFLQQHVNALAAAHAMLAELAERQVGAVPERVTNFQARAALTASGMFEAANAAAIQAGGAALQAWEYANHFYRQSPVIEQLGAALGLTSEQLDQLFIAASQIEI